MRGHEATSRPRKTGRCSNLLIIYVTWCFHSVDVNLGIRIVLFSGCMLRYSNTHCFPLFTQVRHIPSPGATRIRT